MAYKLQRALYGLKQAPRAWHDKLQQVLVGKLGYAASTADPSLFIKHSSSGSIWVLVYVDDILMAAKQLEQVQQAKADIMGQFKARDMGEASCYLGLEVSRDRAAHTLLVSQLRYADGVLGKFSMPTCRGRSTPLAPGTQLSQQHGECMGSSRFAELIGCLQYAAQHTRPDLAHSVSLLSRFMSAPTTLHWTATLSILKCYGSTKQRLAACMAVSPAAAATTASKSLGLGTPAWEGAQTLDAAQRGMCSCFMGGSSGVEKQEAASRDSQHSSQ